MKEIYGKYLSALRAFVHGTVPEKLNTEETMELLDLANINSTGGMVSYVYKSHPGLVDGQLQPIFRRRCLQEIALYAKRAELMKLLLEELDKHGIDCILFKGFVVRNYYSIPELRTFGDIDFVIRKEDREKSDRLMKQLGYEPRDTWEPAYSYRKGTEYYEIHTDVMEVDVSDKADYPGYFSHIWEHVKPSETMSGQHMLEFTPEFHFLYLLTHIAKHISNAGAGIRMYLDISFFIRHFGDTLDWAWISRELQKLQFEAFSNMVLTAVEQWFGVKSPLPLKDVPAQVMEDFLEFTLTGGIYGRVGRDKSVVFLKQQGRNEENVSKWKTLLYHGFPPAKALENKYTYLRKHRVLLPVAWVHRLADSRKEWGRFADNTKNILTADTEEVLKLKRMYKELGL